MKVILAPDSFKGSMTSIEIINIIRQSFENHFDQLEVNEIPIADGGEGTIDALIHSGGGYKAFAKVQDPLGYQISAEFAVMGDTAVIEMAATSGLTLMLPEDRNPLLASSYGTGQMIKHVLDEGYRNIVIGIGGSGTNDGGTGAMQALGVVFQDALGLPIDRMNGINLKDIKSIDMDGLDPRIKDCTISVMCDVTNPLTGREGATMVYGPQKGATLMMLEELESGMCSYRDLLADKFGRDIGALPGAGAAGGIGAALVAFLNADLVKGIDKILELTGFDTHLESADLVVTGEGRVDGQSANGKVIHGIGSRAKPLGVPVVVIAGGMDEGGEKVYDLGISAILTITDRPMNLEEAMDQSKRLMHSTADNLCRLLKLSGTK